MYCDTLIRWMMDNEGIMTSTKPGFFSTPPGAVHHGGHLSLSVVPNLDQPRLHQGGPVPRGTRGKVILTVCARARAHVSTKDQPVSFFRAFRAPYAGEERGGMKRRSPFGIDAAVVRALPLAPVRALVAGLSPMGGEISLTVVGRGRPDYPRWLRRD